MNSRDGRRCGSRAARAGASVSRAARAAFAVGVALTVHCALAGAQAGAPATGPGAVPTAAQAPPMAVPSGAPPMTLTSPPGTADEDIRDIRGPKYLAPAWLIPAIVAAVVAVALLGYGIWRWTRRRRAPRILSSSEAALQRLEEIRVLMQPATVREFGIEVSDVVRRYVERGFDITATHRTTEEFLHDLLETTHPGLMGHRELLAGFLEQCDLAKFAGMALSPQSMEVLHASARSFVIESSKPVPVPPAPSDAATPAAGMAAANPRPAPGARAL